LVFLFSVDAAVEYKNMPTYWGIDVAGAFSAMCNAPSVTVLVGRRALLWNGS
jgi:hypothetical protein